MAVKAQGSKLYFIDKINQQVRALDCATSLSVSGSTVGQRDTTCLEEEDQTFEPGMRTPGTASVGLYPDPSTNSHLIAYQHVQQGLSTKFALGWSDGTSAPTLLQAGAVSGVTITSGGSGYSAATVSFAAPPSGGVQATGTVVLTGGVITAITITNPGAGYTTPPAVTITGTAGTGGAATAEITDDLSFSLPSDRSFLLFDGYFSGFPFELQIGANVASTVAIQMSGAVGWVPKVA